MPKTQLRELRLNIWKVRVAMTYITEIKSNFKVRKKVLFFHLNHSSPRLADTVNVTNTPKLKWYYFPLGILTTTKYALHDHPQLLTKVLIWLNFDTLSALNPSNNAIIFNYRYFGYIIIFRYILLNIFSPPFFTAITYHADLRKSYFCLL